MLASHSSYHGDWEMHTSCRENDPDDWKPGQPTRYAVRGFAEYRGRPDQMAIWTSTGRITWNDGLEKHTTDSSAGHEMVRVDLRKAIDARRVPTE